MLGDADLDVAAVRVLDVDELLALGGVSLRHPALVVVAQFLQWLVVDLDGGVDAARALEVLARAHRLQAALQSTNTSHTHTHTSRALEVLARAHRLQTALQSTKTTNTSSTHSIITPCSPHKSSSTLYARAYIIQ